MSSSSTEAKLQIVFANVNEWLKFAEAKNAGLLAVSAACFGVAAQLYLGVHRSFCDIYLLLFMALAGLSLLVAALSFLPFINLPTSAQTEARQLAPKDNDNLLFYGTIADLSPDEYLRKIKDASAEQDSPVTKWEKDYAHQIVTNSKIARRKFQHFKFGLWLFVAAIVSPPIGIIIYEYHACSGEEKAIFCRA